MGPCGAPRLRCYRTRGAWRPVRVIVDTIPVKGEPPRVVRLEFTEHGPIVAEDSARGRAFVVRFVGSEPGTAGYLAQLSIDRATDWRSFLSAAARWRLPTENLVYADVDGHIGWIAAGLMPIRSWSGLLPVAGDGRYEWQGFLRPDELPQSYDPASGMIVTANNNILPPGYARALNYDWAPPYRAHRIARMLGPGARLTVEDFERLQLDEYSLPASELVPVLVAAARRRGTAAGPEIDTLGAWDYVMSKDRTAPLLYEAWLGAVGKRLARTRTGGAAEFVLPIPTLVRVITAPDGAFGRDPAAARDSLALAALDDAVAEISTQLGADRSRWSWGALHRAVFRHPVAAAFDLPGVPRGGDGNTVNATGGGADYVQRYGASYREILDCADWDRSVATSVPGWSSHARGWSRRRRTCSS